MQKILLMAMLIIASSSLQILWTMEADEWWIIEGDTWWLTTDWLCLYPIVFMLLLTWLERRGMTPARCSAICTAGLALYWLSVNYLEFKNREVIFHSRMTQEMWHQEFLLWIVPVTVCSVTFFICTYAILRLQSAGRLR